MKLPIEPVSQRNSEWKIKKLGTSSVTIGNYGCYLVCLHMLLKYLLERFGYDEDPGTLNEIFKINGVYDNGNMINGWAVPKVYPKINYDEHYFCLTTACDLAKIDNYLERGLPVIAGVGLPADLSKELEFDGTIDHFILIIGKVNGSYLINDPWEGETYFFEAKYGDPSESIFGLRLYSGPVPQQEEPQENPNTMADNEVVENDGNIGTTGPTEPIVIGQTEAGETEQSTIESATQDTVPETAETGAETGPSFLEKLDYLLGKITLWLIGLFYKGGDSK